MSTGPTPTEAELAEGELDTIDEALMNSVADLYRRADPMPDGLVARVQFAMTLDALQTEVAELQRLSEGSLAYRGDAADEAVTVTFTSSSLTTMVTISGISPGVVRIDGWIAPGGGISVELRLEQGSRNTVADEDGRFVFESVPKGLAQFILRSTASAGSPVVTPSMEL